MPRDVTFVLNQYACLYALTDKENDIYEDDIPEAMKEQVGERMGLVREKALYGGMKAATNKFYSLGTSRSTVSSERTICCMNFSVMLGLKMKSEA